MATNAGTQSPEEMVNQALAGSGDYLTTGSTKSGKAPAVSAKAQEAAASSPGKTGLTTKSKALIQPPVIGVDEQGKSLTATDLTSRFNNTYSQKYISNKTPAQRKKLQEDMYALGLYPKGYTPTYGYVNPDGQDIKALNGLLIVGINTGKGDVDSIIKDVKKNPQLLQLARQSAGVITGKATKTLTTFDASATELTNSFLDYFNDKPTKEETKAYAAAVNAAEKKSSRALTTDQRKEILLNIVEQRAKKEYDLALTGDQAAAGKVTDGIIGKYARSIKSAYADNGIMIDDNTIYKQAVKSLRSQQAYENVLDTINVQAKLQFPALANYIDQGKTVKEILNPYIQLKSQILEKPVEQISVSEFSNVASDPNKLMSISDYKASLYQDPAWKKTKNYMDTSMGDARALLSMMGLG